MICQGLVHRSGRRAEYAGGQDALRGRDACGSSQKSIFPSPVCYRCFLHSVSSVTINEVTDQSGARRRRHGVSLRRARILLRCGGDFARRNWDNAARGLCYLLMVYVIGTNRCVKTANVIFRRVIMHALEAPIHRSASRAINVKQSIRYRYFKYKKKIFNIYLRDRKSVV